MRSVVECADAPRDQGLGQGQRLREAVRREVRWIRRQGIAAQGEAVAREIARHFPQVAERAAGLALGAGVSRRLLLQRLGWEVEDGAGGAWRASAGRVVAAAPERTGAGALLARAADPPDGLVPEALLRRTRPDPGHVSLEASFASLPVAVAGVNEAGLAVALASLWAPRRCAPAAPALVLVSECLQRFETADVAADFCQARPTGGFATLLLADAEGAVRGVAVDGGAVRVLEPASGLLFGPGSGPRTAELEARCRASKRLDAEALLAALAPKPEADRCDGASLCLDPAGRCALALDSHGSVSSVPVAAPLP